MTIEYVVLLPALFALLFLAVQIAVFYQARSVAIAAAAEGARTAGAEGATAGSGEIAARAFVAAAGGDDVLPGLTVTVTRTPARADVTVAGTSLSLIPGWQPRITQHASVPVERITG